MWNEVKWHFRLCQQQQQVLSLWKMRPATSRRRRVCAVLGDGFFAHCKEKKGEKSCQSTFASSLSLLKLFTFTTTTTTSSSRTIITTILSTRWIHLDRLTDWRITVVVVAAAVTSSAQLCFYSLRRSFLQHNNSDDHCSSSLTRSLARPSPRPRLMPICHLYLYFSSISLSLSSSSSSSYALWKCWC